MCNKVVDSCRFVFYSVPDQYEAQEMCNKAVHNYSHKLELENSKHFQKNCF